MKRHRLEAEPGQNQSRAPAELFCRGNIPPGGGIIAIDITIDPLIERGSISINIFTSTSPPTYQIIKVVNVNQTNMMKVTR